MNSGVAPAGTNMQQIASLMTTDELYGRDWILAYEGNVKGWLPSGESVDHFAADPAFHLPRQSGVTFYDPTAVAVPPEPVEYDAEGEGSDLYDA